MHLSLRKITCLGLYRVVACIICLSSSAALGLTSAAQLSDLHTNTTPNIYFKRIFDDHDVATRAVHGIEQDDQGFIWFGTERGLYRYDGYQLTRFGDLDDTVPVTNITSMHIAKNSQTLWIGAYDRLIQFDLRDYSYTVHTAEQPNGIELKSYYITHITSTANGAVIVSTGHGFWIISEQATSLEYFNARVNNNEVDNKIVWSTHFDHEQQQLWIGTNNGIRRLDWQTRKISQPAILQEALQGLAVHDIHKDTTGELWLATSNGLFRIESDSSTTHHYTHAKEDEYSIGANQIWRIFEDQNNKLWIGTDHGGLNVFDKDNNRFNRYLHLTNDENTISSNTVKSITQDNLGNMWAGNFPTGVNLFSPYDSPLSQLKHINNNSQSLSHNSVLAIIEDSHNNLWLGTDGGGLDLYNPQNQQITHFKSTEQGLTDSVILSLEVEVNDRIWIGTYQNGLKVYDPDTKKFMSSAEISDKLNFNAMSIWALELDSKHNLWIGTQQQGTFRYNLTNGEVTHFPLSPLNEEETVGAFVFSIFEDSQQNIWIGTLSGINLLRPDNKNFLHISSNTQKTDALKNGVIFTIYEDSREQLWFGTSNGLSRLLDKDALTFTTLSQKDGFNSNSIRGLIEDKQGHLWVSTDQGISRIDSDTKKIQNHRNGAGWLPGPYNNSAILSRHDGSLAFGGINGLQFLDTSLYRPIKKAPAIALTALNIFTETVTPKDESGILTKIINQTQEIKLTHKQSMFSIEFAALTFQESQKNTYAYRLEGFDKDWREIGNQHNAVYTNLDPGTYTFRVKASNNYGIWNEADAALTIIQKAAPWHTWWAYCGYILVISIIPFWLFRIKFQKLEFEKELEHKSNENLRKLNKLKSNFLANTSHELLTPLNGIIGLSSLLKEELKHVNESAINKIEMIHSSGNRLSGQVRNILDFSLISEGKLKLNIETINLSETIAECISFIKPITQTKNVFLFNNTNNDIYIKADKERLTHIIVNLISNGITFTDEGHVTITTNTSDCNVRISIEDSGKGISSDDIEKIFHAFDQADTNAKGNNGLGLSLSQKLVELHGSHIKIDSTLGKGSKFSFTLPLANNSEIAEYNKFNSNIKENDHNTNETTNKENHINNTETKKILIVDDDTVNRIVLRGILKLKNYEIVEADSGARALECVNEQPDIALIILDIMMPKMDGYEVCSTLRKTHSKQVLPIIFLTAKTNEEAYQKGIAVGGNDFLTKPTSKTLLLPCVEKHIKKTTCTIK